MNGELEIDKPLKYVIFVILFLEIVSFMFNPKIKVQMMICVLMLTAIASVSLVIDMHNGIGDSKLIGLTGKMSNFIRRLPNIIQNQYASAPIGWFIGLIALMNIFAIGIITKLEYNSTKAKKFSKKNKNKIKSVKGFFISTIVSTVMMAIISSLLLFDVKMPQTDFFSKVSDLMTKIPSFAEVRSNPGVNILVFVLFWLFAGIPYLIYKGLALILDYLNMENSLGLLAAYTFFASVYTIHESRMLHNLFVNDLIAD